MKRTVNAPGGLGERIPACRQAGNSRVAVLPDAKILRRGWESNPRIGVLQTPALPLGYRAILSKF